jgi:hypothetical protein
VIRSAWLRWLLPVLLVGVVLATFRDYGYSWDETWQNRWAGRRSCASWPRAGWSARPSPRLLYLYGGTFDAAADLLVRLLPLERDTRHLANALAGLLGLAGCWRLAPARQPGRGLGALPRPVRLVRPPLHQRQGHPFAAGFTWALFLALRWVEGSGAAPPATLLLGSRSG